MMRPTLVAAALCMAAVAHAQTAAPPTGRQLNPNRILVGPNHGQVAGTPKASGPLPSTGGTILLGQTAAPTSSGAGLTLQNTQTTAESIYNPQVPTGWFTADGYRVSLVVPFGATAQNTDAFGYYISNKTPDKNHGGSNVVGLFGTTTCEVDNCSSWAMNPTLTDSLKKGITGIGTGRKLIGGEFDFSATQNGTVVQGIDLLGSSLVQPLGADGYTCGSLSQMVGLAKWSHCFVVPDGVATGGIYLGSLSPSNTPNSPSVPLMLVDYNLNGIGQQVQLQSAFGSLNVSGPTLANYLTLSPAAAGQPVSLSAQGADRNVTLSLSAKGNSTVALQSPLTVGGYISVTGFLDVIGGAFVLTDDSKAVPVAIPQLGAAITANQQSKAEVDFWNTYANSPQSFNFDQVTGVGTFTQVASFSRAGLTTTGLTLTGDVTIGGSAGVSCAAGTVSLSTLTISNGIVTHC